MQLPHPSQALSSTQVLVRFSLRMAILVCFASFGGIGFAHNLAALLWMTVILSAAAPSQVRIRLLSTPGSPGQNCTCNPQPRLAWTAEAHSAEVTPLEQPQYYQYDLDIGKVTEVWPLSIT